jgi:hypothetical protein
VQNYNLSGSSEIPYFTCAKSVRMIEIQNLSQRTKLSGKFLVLSPYFFLYVNGNEPFRVAGNGPGIAAVADQRAF